MIESSSILVAITLIAGIVYLTRLGGYVIGLQLRHIPGIQPVLEALPGCAFMAMLVPAVRQGSSSEILALVVLVALMWRTNNVAISTIAGMAILLTGNAMLDQPG